MTDLFERFVRDNEDYVREFLEKRYERIGTPVLTDLDHVWMNTLFDGNTPISDISSFEGVKIPENRNLGFDIKTFENVEIIADDNIISDPKQAADEDIKEILGDVEEKNRI